MTQEIPHRSLAMFASRWVWMISTIDVTGKLRQLEQMKQSRVQQQLTTSQSPASTGHHLWIKSQAVSIHLQCNEQYDICTFTMKINNFKYEMPNHY